MRVRIDKVDGENVVLELPDRDLITAPRVLFDCPKEGDYHDITIDPKSVDKHLNRLADNLFE